ncbi:MAG: hypothetical protein LBF15_00025 [Candidatus Peribacteria bacterium]|jgi:hypothetical protein|nr:hypothetical protein [Candidatus Peribacteria bacterium]
MNNQIEIYAFEESIDFKKQQEERERLVEAVKFVNSVLKEAIAVEIEERNTVRIAFF